MKQLRASADLLKRLRLAFGARAVAKFTAAVLITLFFVAFFPRTTRQFDSFLYDLRHKVGARYRAADPSIVVVGIDMRTLAASEKRWPWPREEVAAALSAIREAEPAGVILDILFQNQDTEAGDTALEDEISRHDNLILISILEEQRSAHGVNLSRFRSLDRLVKSATAEGFVWGVLDPDGVLRSFKISEPRLNAKSSVYLALQYFYGANEKELSSLPVQVPVVFAQADGGIPTISLNQILDDRERTAPFLKGKTVIFGVTAQAMHDYHNTPTGVVAGAKILACTLDTLLKRRIGMFYFNSVSLRCLMIIVGAFFGWFTTIYYGSLLVSPLFCAVVTIFLMLLSELTLLHLPVAPFIICWLMLSLVAAVARYFDNLFMLRDIKHEAANAHEVQRQLLPCNELELNGYKAFGVSKSATELCGDYFDYFIIEERYMFVFLGDVTGHGIASALAMAVAKASVLVTVNKKLRPQEILETINLILFQAMQRRLMMTAALIWLDTQTGEFEYRNCGHPYPYYLPADGEIDLLAAPGVFLGIKAKYRCGKAFSGQMNKGDRILLYSDALIESFPEAITEDGFTLFKNFLAQRPSLPIENACRDIIDQHPHFKTGLPQPDDFTVVIIERAM